MSETPTPLTDAELALMDSIAGMTTDDVVPRAAAEIRALRAENAELFARNCEKGQALSVAEAEKATLRASEARLLAALKTAERNLALRIESRVYSVSDKPALEQIRAAIAAAEGRAEG